MTILLGGTALSLAVLLLICGVAIMAERDAEQGVTLFDGSMATAEP